MRVVQRLRVIGLVAFALTLAGAIGTRSLNGEADQALDEARQAQRFARDMADLSSLAGEYLGFGGERVEKQWVALILRLQREPVLIQQGPENLSVARSLAEIDVAFRAMVKLRRRWQAEPRRGGEPSPPTTVLPEELTQAGFIRAESRRVYVHASVAAEAAIQQAQAIQDRGSAATMALLAGLLGVAGVVGYGLARRLARAVPKLNDGLRHFADGQLTHEIDVGGDDELADIASSANRMSRRLDGLLADERRSRVALQTEASQRQALAVQLQASEARYRRFFESSMDGVLLTKPQDGAIIEANAQALATLGYTIEELRQLGRAAMVDPADPAVTHALSVRAKEGSFRGEITLRRKGGASFVAELSSVVFTGDGDQLMSSVIFRDVTERKAEQQELDRHRRHLEDLVVERTAELARLRDKAQAANQAKARFLATISHEIRTPMNAVIGFAQAAAREPLDAQRQRQLVDRIAQAATHLLAVVNDVLDLAKIDAGKLEIDQSVFAVPDVVNEVLQLASQQAADKGLALRSECDPGLPQRVRGDPTRLRQALLNLVGNALKFTECGDVTVCVTCSGEAPNGSVGLRFDVVDTGPGLRREQLERVFEAFVQADAEVARRAVGTGLGLAITRELARLMGGDAGVQSESGQGSRFWFTVLVGMVAADEAGRTAPARDQRELEQAVREAFRGANVLLAEDNVVNQEVALGILGAVGIQPVVVDDGADAVEQVRRRRFDLILMDMQMPRMGGLEATRLIRQLDLGRDVPILAMTANAFDEDRQACLREGMNDFVHKPVIYGDFFATLMRWTPDPDGRD